MLLSKERNKNINVCIGKLVCFCREMRGYKQKDVSIDSKIGQSTLSKLEHGDSEWSIDQIFSVCNTLDVDANKIIKAARDLM